MEPPIRGMGAFQLRVCFLLFHQRPLGRRFAERLSPLRVATLTPLAVHVGEVFRAHPARAVKTFAVNVIVPVLFSCCSIYTRQRINSM